MAYEYHTMKITKEDYDEIMKESNGSGHVPGKMESRFFSDSVIFGYGLYGTKAYEKDGEHFIDYKIGDSCD